MQVLQRTINRSPIQPGYIWTEGVCVSVQQRLISTVVSLTMRSLVIANNPFKSYESDLGMT